VSASAATGWVVGNLKKFVNNNAADSTHTYEVGTASFYTPLTITPLANFSGTDGTSALVVASTAGEHANVSTSGINQFQDVNSYWSVTGVKNTGTWNVAAGGYKPKASFQPPMWMLARTQTVHREEVPESGLELHYRTR
jgi:MSHA biogenesis protein MshQ